MSKAQNFSVVGKRVQRIEGFDKVTGDSAYIADIYLPAMLVGKVLRSPFPHARIRNIDISKAEKVPGVRAVVTAEDTIKRPWGAFFADQYILSVGKTRYVGEEVAAVAAIDPDIAEEAIDLRSEEHTSELQSPCNLVCRLLLDTRPVLAEIYTLSLHDALPI